MVSIFFRVHYRKNRKQGNGSKGLKEYPVGLSGEVDVPGSFRRNKTLSSNPFSAGIVKLTHTENSYRLRVGDYRMVLNIPDQRFIRFKFHLQFILFYSIPTTSIQ
jgi:hypothetical protein